MPATVDHASVSSSAPPAGVAGEKPGSPVRKTRTPVSEGGEGTRWLCRFAKDTTPKGAANREWRYGYGCRGLRLPAWPHAEVGRGDRSSENGNSPDNEWEGSTAKTHLSH